ncbi:MAG TPA: hypothetical protein VK629_18645 [Steroidobacteraceae bacterium]|nr:hypothetical protein [Steroidobacteraceae bacterium]
MPRQKNALAIATGKLVVAIQREVGDAFDDAASSQAHEVMHRAHLLQQAAQGGFVRALLSGVPVNEYLGAAWLAEHPSLNPSIQGLLAAIDEQLT